MNKLSIRYKAFCNSIYWQLVSIVYKINTLFTGCCSSSSSIQFWSGFIPVNKGGRIYPTLPAISPTPTLHLARFFASSFFKPLIIEEATVQILRKKTNSHWVETLFKCPVHVKGLYSSKQWLEKFVNFFALQTNSTHNT